MRRSFAARFILVSLLAAALVLPAASPASATYTAPVCSKTSVAGAGGHNADDPNSWVPTGVPTASDIVCITEGNDFWGGGTITAAEVHVLDTSWDYNYMHAALNTPALYVAPGETLEAYSYLTDVDQIASGTVITGFEGVGYSDGAPVGPLEVAQDAKLIAYSSGNYLHMLNRELNVYGEINIQAYPSSDIFLYSEHAINIPGTLRINDLYNYSAGAPCSSYCEISNVEVLAPSLHIGKKLIVEEGVLDLFSQSTPITVGTGALAPVTTDNGKTVLRGPDEGYEVHDSASLYLGGQQIQEIGTDLELRGTGMVSTDSGHTFPSALTTLDTVRSGASLTLKDEYDAYYWGVNRTSALTTTAPLTNHGDVSLGDNNSLTASSYTQDGTVANPATTTLGENATLATTSGAGVALEDGAFTVTAPIFSVAAKVNAEHFINSGAALNLNTVAGAPTKLNVTGGYKQTGAAASTNFAFDAATGNSMLAVTPASGSFAGNGQAQLLDGSVNLTVPSGRTFPPGAQRMITAGAVTLNPAVSVSGLPTDTTQQSYEVAVNPAGTALQLEANDAAYEGEQSADATDLISYGGHYYRVVPTTLSWNDARTAAASTSYLFSPGHLVTIGSGGENTFIHNLVPEAGGHGYIGLTDQDTENQFRWVNGEPVSYTGWGGGEPNNSGNEDCVHQYPSGVWNDTICSARSGDFYVVEYSGPFDSDHDSDGVRNGVDTDDDNDGVLDTNDAFPRNASESVDTDGDGTGNNVDEDDDNDGVRDELDVFPLDASETEDSDGDGVGNNADAFDDDASETTDSDGDGVGDNADVFPDDADETEDTDEDGVGDNADAFDGDPTETTDSDEDGVGNNADAFDGDPTETTDSDEDGVGNNADAFDDDPTETTDSDEDGVGDNADAFPDDPDKTSISDGVDTTPPANPTIATSHNEAWSSDRTVRASFSDVDAQTVGYAVVWDDAATTSPAAVQTQSVGVSTATSPELSSGAHYLHVRTVDAAGNWSDTAHAGPFNIDVVAPGRASIQSPAASLLTRARDIEVSWSAASDAHSGIRHYIVEYARTPFTPGADATGFTVAATTSALSVSVPLESGARNCVRVITEDVAGNQTASPTRCINAPFAASQFTASVDDGWEALDRQRFAFGSAMVTYEQGASLRHRVTAKQVGIRAIVCRTCGDIHLRWAGEGKPFARFDLRGEWDGVPDVMMAPVFSNRTTGKLIVEVASTNRRVVIDSIIVK